MAYPFVALLVVAFFVIVANFCTKENAKLFYDDVCLTQQIETTGISSFAIYRFCVGCLQRVMRVNEFI